VVLKPKLLKHPNIPKPLHGVNPRTIYGQEWWDVRRQKAYKENDYCCWACGVHKSKQLYKNWLEAHESYDLNYTTGKVKLLEITALCHACHRFIHNGLLWIMYNKGEVEFNYTMDIMEHGMNVLKEAGLKPHPHAANIYLRLRGYDKEEIYKIILEKKLDIQDISLRTPAAWNEWHLDIDGECHYSPYEDYVAWYHHYNTKKETT
jgi:hypothetical protein